MKLENKIIETRENKRRLESDIVDLGNSNYRRKYWTTSNSYACDRLEIDRNQQIIDKHKLNICKYTEFLNTYDTEDIKPKVKKAEKLIHKSKGKKRQFCAELEKERYIKYPHLRPLTNKVRKQMKYDIKHAFYSDEKKQLIEYQRSEMKKHEYNVHELEKFKEYNSMMYERFIKIRM